MRQDLHGAYVAAHLDGDAVSLPALVAHYDGRRTAPHGCTGANCPTCGTPDARPCAPPPAVDLSELVGDLSNCGHPVAAWLVKDGLREYADLVAAELRRERGQHEPLVAQVLAWGEGRDAAIVASNAAWSRCGCEGCALAALASGDADTHCAGCAASVAESMEGAR